MAVSYGKNIQRQMAQEGIADAELQEMVAKAAITSLAGFNRRYHEWVFKVKDGVLERMDRAEVAEVSHVGDTMEDDCPACEGKCCAKCHWTGTVRVRVVDTTAAHLAAARNGMLGGLLSARRAY